VAADQDRLSWETIYWKLGVLELGSVRKNGRQRLDDSGLLHVAYFNMRYSGKGLGGEHSG
jgi:hypothetical protein